MLLHISFSSYVRRDPEEVFQPKVCQGNPALLPQHHQESQILLDVPQKQAAPKLRRTLFCLPPAQARHFHAWLSEQGTEIKARFAVIADACANTLSLSLLGMEDGQRETILASSLKKCSQKMKKYVFLFLIFVRRSDAVPVWAPSGLVPNSLLSRDVACGWRRCQPAMARWAARTQRQLESRGRALHPLPSAGPPCSAFF